MEIAQGKQTFDKHISKLKEQWAWFSEHETKFVDFRNKRLAHLEVSTSGDPTEIASLEWDLAIEAIKRLIEIAELLSSILGNPSRDADILSIDAKRKLLNQQHASIYDDDLTGRVPTSHKAEVSLGNLRRLTHLSNWQSSASRREKRLALFLANTISAIL
jgi:hypothetical protein